MRGWRWCEGEAERDERQGSASASASGARSGGERVDRENENVQREGQNEGVQATEAVEGPSQQREKGGEMRYLLGYNHGGHVYYGDQTMGLAEGELMVAKPGK